MNSLMPEPLSIAAKASPGSSPPRNVIKKGLLPFSEGFSVVYRDIFLLKVLLRTELVTEDIRVFFTALTRGWKIPKSRGTRMLNNYQVYLSHSSKSISEFMSTKGESVINSITNMQ